MIGYDNLAINHQILLDLPFREATGIITHDVAKPHHQDVDLINTPTWESLVSGLGVIEFDEASDQYLECIAAATDDLDFTSGDYSIGCWVYRATSSHTNIVIGKYGLDSDGIEVYLASNVMGYLEMRHHHGSLPDVRTGLSSVGWFPNIWYFMGISRSGAFPLLYRNGVSIAVTYDPVTGLSDPDSSAARDLVIGARYTKNANFWHGKLWRPRIWNRALAANEWAQIFERERHWFGV